MKRTIPCLNIDFESADYQTNLYRYYSDFLQHTPVFTTDEGVFYLTRFADCHRLLKDPDFTRRPKTGPSAFCNDNRQPNSFEAMLNDWMVFQDPPQHTRLREPLAAIFTPKHINAMAPDIRNMTVSLLEAIPDNKPVDFINQFAFVLPISVICLMLGIKQVDYQQFTLWSGSLTSAVNTGLDHDIAAGIDAAKALKAYLESHIADVIPGERDDILGALLLAHAAKTLSMDEIVNICVFMLWAGHETTKHLLSNGLLALLQNPLQMRLLKNNPDLMESAIEEMLRYHSPIQKLSRWTREDSYFDDVMIPDNQLVTAIIGAAHRDPNTFDQPDAFIADRTPNRHIAFGKGFHHCLGASLARMEAKITFQELLNRYKNITLIDYQWRTLSAFRSLDKLNVTLET